MHRALLRAGRVIMFLRSALPPLATISQTTAAPGAKLIAAGHTPRQSGLHQAERSMDAAVWAAGMCPRAALGCHLSPI